MNGKKTYIASVIMALLGVLVASGKLTQEQFLALAAIFGGGGMAALRSAIGSRAEDAE